MIALTDRSQFVNAEKKAKQVKPVVSMVELGTYIVWGAATNYTVEFGKVNGQFAGSCTCPAHVKSSTPRPCYHLVAAAASHRIQVGIRRQVKAASSPTVANWVVSEVEAA